MTVLEGELVMLMVSSVSMSQVSPEESNEPCVTPVRVCRGSLTEPSPRHIEQGSQQLSTGQLPDVDSAGPRLLALPLSTGH